jgi:hypothetical protein
MENKDEKNSINDDILKCRENILKAGGKLPARPRIPTFEEIISAESTPDPAPVADATSEITESYESEAPQYDMVSDDLEDIDVLEDIDLSDDTDDSEGSGMEVIADEDWHLPSENTEQPENPTLDMEIEEILDKHAEIEEVDVVEEVIAEAQQLEELEEADVDPLDPSSPVVSIEEQQELLTEPEGICKYDDSPTDEDEDQIAKQIGDQLLSMSQEQTEPVTQIDEDQQPDDAIPEFNVYDRILSSERKQSSTRRQGPGKKTLDEKVELPKPMGIVADVINNSKAITEVIQDADTIKDVQPIETINNTEEVQQSEMVKVDEGAQLAENIDICLGVIHGPDNISETQSSIITEIVNRHIADFYGKAV